LYFAEIPYEIECSLQHDFTFVVSSDGEGNLQADGDRDAVRVPNALTS